MINSNLIINGNFDLWQRGTTFSIPYNADYSNGGIIGSTLTAPNIPIADRWYAIDSQIRGIGSTGSISIYREKFDTTDERFVYSENFLTVVNNITGITKGSCHIENKTENSNVFGGQALTLSFFAKATGVTGTTLNCYFREVYNPNGGEFKNVFGTVNISQYWTKYSLSLLPPFIGYRGISAGNYFGLGFQIPPTTTVSIGAVKLDFGNNSSVLITDPFEEKTRQDRYYSRTYPYNVSDGTVSLSGNNDINAIRFTVTPNYSVNYQFNGEMYRKPDITFYSPSGVKNDAYNKTASKDMRLTSGTRGWNSATRYAPTGATTIKAVSTTYGVELNVVNGAVVFDDILTHMIADADIYTGPYDRGLDTVVYNSTSQEQPETGPDEPILGP